MNPAEFTSAELQETLAAARAFADRDGVADLTGLLVERGDDVTPAQ